MNLQGTMVSAASARRVGRGALAVLFLGLAAPSQATVYYVRTTGSDTFNGTSPATPWATIGKANSTVVAGDIVYVGPGTYSQAVGPNASGTSEATRIRFIGNGTDPATVNVPGSSFGRRYVSVIGFHMTSNVSFGESAQFCRMDSCIIEGSIWWGGADDCGVHHTVIPPGVNRKVAGDALGVPGNVCYRDTIADCTMTLGLQITSYAALYHRNQSDFYYARNRMFLTRDGADPTLNSARWLNECHRFKFVDNYWQINNTSTVLYYGMENRDSVESCVFLRDTMVNIGYQQRNLMTGTGTYGSGTCRNNQYINCVYVNETSCAFPFEWQAGISGDLLQNSVFAASTGPGLYIQTVRENEVTNTSQIRHCTLVGGPSNGFGVVLTNDRTTPYTGELVMKDNILFTPGTFGVNNWGAHNDPRYWGAAPDKLTADNNLYFAIGGGTNSAIAWESAAGQQHSGAGSGQGWCSSFAQDCASRYGDPRFVASVVPTNGALPDFHLLAGSAAIGMASDGSDVGAYPFGSGGPDLTPPAAVSNLDTLMVNDQNVTLRWTATGDDGTSGMASAYDLRYSASPITSANFSSATAVPVQPVPQAPGTVQSYLMTGLTPGTTYYFAIKVGDEAGNWSAISNVLNVRTYATDTRPPASIQDLTSGL